MPESDRTRVLLPLCFCRECGQDYYSVRRREDVLEPREVSDREGETNGYVYVSEDAPWPDDGPALRARRLASPNAPDSSASTSASASPPAAATNNAATSAAAAPTPRDAARLRRRTCWRRG